MVDRFVRFGFRSNSIRVTCELYMLTIYLSLVTVEGLLVRLDVSLTRVRPCLS
jgi:hypothetical protein